MAKMAKTTFEGEVYSHRQLWTAARSMRARSDAEKKGSMYCDMVAMLLARLTVEAYCNFLIHVLDPDTFDKEREIFGSSTDRKLQWVCGRVGFALDRGRRPYQTVKSLDTLRNRMVHAKPEVYTGEDIHSVEEERPFMRPGELEKCVSPKLCTRALEDVDLLCEELHKQILASADIKQKLRLEPYALKGSLQRQVSSSKLA